MKKGLFYVILFLPALLQAIDLKPWYSRDLQLQGRLDSRFQSYPSVQTPCKDSHYSSDDLFFNGSFLFIYAPTSIEVGSELAITKKRKVAWDNIHLTGRYLWLDDDKGDPVSFTTGLTLSRAWKEAVDDISSFHHGRNEAFLHMALGKQKIKGSTWQSRWWGILGIGTADKWTPWIVANAAYEWNLCDPHRIRLFVNTLWGCGRKELNTCDFKGYGTIDHRSIDLGLRYTYQLDYYGILSIGYIRRVYAHNFPERVNIFTFQYIYPFGPEGDYLILKAYSLITGKSNPF